MKKTVNHKSLLFFAVVTMLSSCQSSKISKMDSKDKIYLSSSDSTSNLYYDFNLEKNSFLLEFNQGSKLYNQLYAFSREGQLEEKRGKNFFGEEEVYTFDVNNSLSEFRKLVFLNEKKKGLQEYIVYKGGLVDKKNSHFFDWRIIDSINDQYQVYIEYSGGRKLKRMKILTGDFSMYSSDLNFKKSEIEFESFSGTFWVKKNRIYDSELDFFQINIQAEFEKEPNHKIIYEDSLKTKSNSYSQVFILRRLQMNMFL